MIYDRLSNVRKYLGINENLDLALNYIAEHLADTPEEIELKGQDVRAFFNAYQTVPESECFFEAHEKFADIQIMRSGSERIAVSNVDALTVTKSVPENDFQALEGPEDLSIIMKPDSFLVVFPGDAHKLKIMVDKPEDVTKTVFKVKM